MERGRCGEGKWTGQGEPRAQGLHAVPGVALSSTLQREAEQSQTVAEPPRYAELSAYKFNTKPKATRQGVGPCQLCAFTAAWAQMDKGKPPLRSPLLPQRSVAASRCLYTQAFSATGLSCPELYPAPFPARLLCHQGSRLSVCRRVSSFSGPWLTASLTPHQLSLCSQLS